ncbi:hypothetical protein GCM10010331_77530 [Streptomyces xanthochromogenes]|nr:hypothetical protein GCM10010331_77530 [Streptomyces xanthochromogenes]
MGQRSGTGSRPAPREPGPRPVAQSGFPELQRPQPEQPAQLAPNSQLPEGGTHAALRDGYRRHNGTGNCHGGMAPQNGSWANFTPVDSVVFYPPPVNQRAALA